MHKLSDKTSKRKEAEITELTTKPERNRGIRIFKIKDGRNTHEVIVTSGKSKVVKFIIKRFPKYEFTYTGDKLLARKFHVDRPSDSGNISNFEGRFNLVDIEGNRKTIRTKNLFNEIDNLIEFL